MFNALIIKTILVALERQERLLSESTSLKASNGLAATQDALNAMRSLDCGDAIASIWTIEDVQSLVTDADGEVVAEDKPGGVSVAEAREVLRLALDGHDATIGVNWDVLATHLESLRGYTSKEL